MTLLGVVQRLFGKDGVSECEEGRCREDFRKEVGKLALGRDLHEADGLGLNLLAEPPHSHTEMPVPGGDDRVACHGDTGRVVFE